MNSRRFIPNMRQAVSVDRVKFQAHKTRHSFSEPCLMWPCAAGIMPSDRWYGRNIKCSVPTGKKVYINTCRDGIIFRFAYLHKQHLTSAAWRSSQWAVLRLRHSEQRLPFDTVFSSWHIAICAGQQVSFCHLIYLFRWLNYTTNCR